MRINGIFTSVALAALVGLAGPVWAEDILIEGRGAGTVNVKFDVLTFSAIVVSEKEQTEQDALAANAKAIRSLSDALKSANVDSGWYKMGASYAHPKYVADGKQRSRLDSYVASAEVAFTVPVGKAKEADGIVDLLNKRGLNASTTATRISDEAAKAAKVEAKRRAIAAARADAQVDAEELECDITHAVSSGYVGQIHGGSLRAARSLAAPESSMMQDTVAVDREGPVNDYRTVVFGCKPKTN